MASGEIFREGVRMSVCIWLPEASPPPPLVSLLPSQLPHPCFSLSSQLESEKMTRPRVRACWPPEAGNCRGSAAPCRDP